MLDGESTVISHGKAKTLYIAVPSKMVTDSSFTIKKGDTAQLHWNPKTQQLTITTTTTNH